jgi:aryl-alcohol dehydrogenase-like predicted oxidoreductase
MHQISFSPTLSSTPVAYGCADILGRLDRCTSIAALSCALDCGITHFDTARMYAYGESERLLGEFLVGQRNTVTIATKFGITPPSTAHLISLARKVARTPLRLLPPLRRLARRGAEGLYQCGQFTRQQATTSLETSLRALRTDWIDLLLLHECQPTDLADNDLLEFLQRAVESGKIRLFGIASSADTALYALRQRPAYAHALQFASDAVSTNAARFRNQAACALLTHSALAPLKHIASALSRDTLLCQRWSRELDLDCARPESLAELLIAHAVYANPNGMVIFSSGQNEHIRSGVKAALETAKRAERIARFANLVTTLLPRHA